MKGRRTVGVVALATAAGMMATGALAAPASAHRGARPAARVLTTGLDGPFGVQALPRGGFLVAESVAGEVTAVGPRGHQRVVLDGLPGVAGVAVGPHRAFAVLGGPNEDGPPPPGHYPATSVVRMDYRGGHVRVLANLERYELRHNPDGQAQVDANGDPVNDSLSNPFAMTLSRRGLLVADGGGNDVLLVDPGTGRVRTFFVPPTVTNVPVCLEEGSQANPGTVGCDPVPTGVAVVGRKVYVSTLGSEAPGAGRVYQLGLWSGRVQRVWKGLTAPTGVAASPDGTVYVSEVLFGAPEGDGPPPPGFDPAAVGRITKIDHGRRTHAGVTMPTGLLYRRGHLYSTAWSVGFFLGIEHAGQVVSVRRGAFG